MQHQDVVSLFRLYGQSREPLGQVWAASSEEALLLWGLYFAPRPHLAPAFAVRMSGPETVVREE